MKVPVPIYRYTITLTDGQQRDADAMSYREVDEFLVFDDVPGTVFQVRREKVDEIRRSIEAVGQQEIEDPMISRMGD